MEVISQRKYYTHTRGYALNHNSSDIEKPFQLELFAPIGTEIYYTLDGSTPNENAIKYTEPILIGDATEKDNIYSMRTDVSAGFQIETVPYAVPDYNIDKCIVIRAVYHDKDGHFGDISTESYFVGYGERSGYDDLNIISIVTEPDNLLDYDTGIYVLGHSYDEYMNIDGVESPYWWWHGANYHNHGSERERPASIQIFNTHKELILRNCSEITCDKDAV